MKFLATTTVLASWATLGVSAAVQERQTTKPLVDSASFQEQITKEKYAFLPNFPLVHTKIIPNMNTACKPTWSN